MKVIGYDPYVSQDRAEALGVTRADSLEEVLRTSDFVSIHIPATEQTRHLINAETLALMKPTAYLINCARGPIVDEAALTEALRAGRLAGAGLDVFDVEPPSVTNPLLAMENVVATPHSAGFTEDSLRKMHLQLAKQLVDIVNGVRPSNLVNPRAWEVAVKRGRIPEHQ
jgi:phosphoglycerate dehydrogenase-like enzyme